MHVEEELKILQTQQLKRARITALVLGSAVIICLMFLMTAYVYKENAKELDAELMVTKLELQACRNSK